MRPNPLNPKTLESRPFRVRFRFHPQVHFVRSVYAKWFAKKKNFRLLRPFPRLPGADKKSCAKTKGGTPIMAAPALECLEESQPCNPSTLSVDRVELSIGTAIPGRRLDLGSRGVQVRAACGAPARSLHTALFFSDRVISWVSAGGTSYNVNVPDSILNFLGGTTP